MGFYIAGDPGAERRLLDLCLLVVKWATRANICLNNRVTGAPSWVRIQRPEEHAGLGCLDF